MQLHVASRHLAADIAVALDATGREHLVIVAKATWRIPDPGQRPRPLPPQPIVLADEYHGAPGESAMRYGTDMARFKPLCDVVFDACAHGPAGRPFSELQAGFEIAGQRKMVRVFGPRLWRKNLNGWSLSNPAPVEKVPLTAAYAIGGTRAHQADGPHLVEAHPHNPSGLGWAGKKTLKQLDGQQAPQLEHPDHPVTRPDSKLPPCALSAVARHWMPRRRHAGTYDDHWRREVFPLLPADFDERFHQFAPEDQQMPHPTGGETVRLINLMPDRPALEFALPRFDMQVRVLRADYRQEAPTAVVDTLFFEPGQRRFSVVWRASVRQHRSIQEFREVAIGPIDPIWWRQRVAGGCAGCGDTPASGAGDNQQSPGEAHA